jgi:hypothetical protein
MHGFGQVVDPFVCLSQAGIPTLDGRCVLTTSDPRKAACEVRGAGYQWEPNTQICLPPWVTQPAKSDLATQIAQAVCGAMAGRWDPVSLQCQTLNNKYGVTDLQTSALPPDPCPPDRPVKTPEGCFPHPGGVEDRPSSATVALPTPTWVMPVIIGAGAVAVFAIIMQSRS